MNLLKKLNHENIVAYIGAQKDKDHLHIVMEFVENGSLSALLKKFGRLPESVVAKYMQQTLAGLAYLHEQGVVHRDIKGANLLLTISGGVKLADFGVSTNLEGGGGDAYANAVGTPYWMAPEVIELHPPSTASDVWSVGCSIIELMTGEPPYFDLAAMPALFRIVQDEHPPLPENISESLRDFLLQTFQKDPNLRVSAEQLLKHPWITNPPVAGDGSVGLDATSLDDLAPEKKKKRKGKKSKEGKERKTRRKPGQGGAPKKAKAETAAPETSPASKRQSKHYDSPELIMDKQSKPAPAEAVKAMDSAKFVSPRGSMVDRGVKTRAALPADAWEAPAPAADKPPAPKLVLSKFAENDDEDDDPFAGMSDDEDGAKPAAPLKLAVSASTSGAKGLRPQLITPQSLMLVGGGKSNSALNQFVEADDDDFDMAFEKDGFDEMDEEEGNAGQDGFADVGEVDLASRLKTLAIGGGGAAGAEAADEEDDEDVFADMLDDDEEDDAAKQQAARDAAQRMRLSNSVQRQVARIQEHQGNATDDAADVLDAFEELLDIFSEDPDARGLLITHHGMIPIVETLASADGYLLYTVLRLVNQIVEDDEEIQDNLAMIGGVPTIMQFGHPRYPADVRFEAANFAYLICHSSPQTLRSFIAARGLPLLVAFVEANYADNKELVLMAIDSVLRIFALQVNTPKNDFCRLFAKAGLLPRLALALKNASLDSDPTVSEYEEKIVNLLLLFSQADFIVKKHMAELSVLEVLMEILHRLEPAIQAKLLRVIKNLSMDPNTLDNLKQSGVFRKLIFFLDERRQEANGAFASDMQNQVLNALFNLCRINRARQEEAAAAGIVPHLQRIIRSNSPLKQFALPIICDLSHAGKRARFELWKNDSVAFFIWLLSMDYWRVIAVDSLSSWLVDESKKVESVLCETQNAAALVGALNAVKNPLMFDKLLEPLLRMVMTSVKLNRTLSSKTDFIAAVVSRLDAPKAQARVQLLKILLALFDHHKHPQRMVEEYKLTEVLERLAEDPSLVVREMRLMLTSAFLGGAAE